MSAFGTGHLRNVGMGVFPVLCCEELKLSAGGAAVDLDKHRACVGLDAVRVA